MITVISVGKKYEYAEAIRDYEKRLQGVFAIRWVLVPNSAKNGPEARKTESEGIFKAINSSDYIVLLDERGVQLTSPEFSELLTTEHSPVLVIGGAYGVSDELRQRADKVVALGKMVFPHQLVRLILTEQIYRAQTIAQGHPYHHK
ncbi:MAG: 23S rRNA (pseudouridine(1915)-N(3))-methyltransferase RlmH [Candidatus Nomurabacteria bacterium]|jgi:23S rRNA (pseudouridine1915-N3)-methyltransferase|nr:23S rRNA (pseudouridine(1915)-N(3))-methyltransferase RlmH [Candidatus Nomurabacteria bacterium]